MPDPPSGLAELVSDLEQMGFEIEREEWDEYPSGGDLLLHVIRPGASSESECNKTAVPG